MPNRVSVLWPFFGTCLLLTVGYLLLTPVRELRAAPQATVLQVDRLDDPALPTGNACTAAPNDCTLRGAVDAAADADSIELSVIGTIVLQSPITLSKHLTITSVSAADHVIDGNNNSIIFAIEPDMFEDRIVILEGLTLQNGFNPTGNGGAVTMQNATVTMRDVIFQGNVATGQGGALDVSPIIDHATLNLSNVTFRNNRALQDSLSGGAIYVRAMFMVPVQLFIDDSLFENNVGGSLAAGDGGAIMADALHPGANLDLEIRNTAFISNGSQLGGAIALKTFAEEPGGSSSLDTWLYDNEFVSNQGEQGGAIYMQATGTQAQATLTISNSTFATNTAALNGGALYNQSSKEDGINPLASIVSIRNSAFHNNRASTGDGGALYNNASATGVLTSSIATMDLRNVTLSGNFAAGEGGAIFASTAGITSTQSIITATHVTAFGNSLSGGNDFHLETANFSQNSLYFKNSIIAGSDGESCLNDDNSNIDGANNLIQDATCGSDNPFRLGVATGVIPTLADNGGPTLTHGLYLGSNAIDTVPAGECTVGNTATLVLRDQRGQTRPFAAACDIGAFEATAPPAADPITGLSATNDGPTQLGMPTTLAASVTGGEVESYSWNYGDGGSGIANTHTFTQSGVYTATVVANNTTNTLTATTTVYVGDAVVEVGNNFYDPTPVTIPVGGKVVWVLRAGTHSVTADDDSFEQPAGSNWPPFINAFNTAKTYDYHCTVHGLSMAGKVIVGGDSPPDGIRLPTIRKADEPE